MKLTTTYSSGRLTVRLSGELDHHSARSAMRTIDQLIDEYIPRDFVLDMSGLSFMDSSGIAVILKADRRIRQGGGRIYVTNPPRQPMRVIDASGIGRLVHIEEE